MAWTDRYVRADAAGGGDGTTDANSGATGAWTLAEAASNAAAGQRINIRNGTYSTSALTWSNAGTTSAPIWLRGFNSTPGDLDADNTLEKPLISLGANIFSIAAAFYYLSNLRFEGSPTTGGTLQATSGGSSLIVWRCRAVNTGTNALSSAFRPTGAQTKAVGCHFQATTSAACVSLQNNEMALLGCYVEGGNVGVLSGGRNVVAYNVIDDPNSHGVDCGTTATAVLNNTIWSAGGDGIRCPSTSVQFVIGNNLIVDSGGYAINFSAGVNGNSLVYGNAYRGNTSGEVNNLAEDWRWLSASLGADPFTAPASNDFSLAASAKALGYPGAFEGGSLVGYLDPGAVQRQEPAGGGGVSRARVVNAGGV